LSATAIKSEKAGKGSVRMLLLSAFSDRANPGLFSSYFDLCFFKSIPHTITAAKKTRIKYHKFPM